MDNPIKNKVQALTVERYLDYLNLKLEHKHTSDGERDFINHEIKTLSGQLGDYNRNIAIRLVVDNTVS